MKLQNIFHHLVFLLLRLSKTPNKHLKDQEVYQFVVKHKICSISLLCKYQGKALVYVSFPSSKTALVSCLILICSVLIMGLDINVKFFSTLLRRIDYQRDCRLLLQWKISKHSCLEVVYNHHLNFSVTTQKPIVN